MKEFWMILFSAAIHADASAFQPKVAVGPMPTLIACAAAGALAISNLNQQYPDKDFRIECGPDRDLRRHDGVPLLDLQQAVDVVSTD